MNTVRIAMEYISIALDGSWIVLDDLLFSGFVEAICEFFTKCENKTLL